MRQDILEDAVGEDGGRFELGEVAAEDLLEADVHVDGQVAQRHLAQVGLHRDRARGDLMDRLGVPFNRTPEGYLDRRRFGGMLYKRTAFAGATTGQQLLYALDEQTRRWETEGKVTKYEFWEFLWPVLHNEQCVGIIAQDMRTMQIKSFPADAVVMATGGNGLIFGKSTMSVICTGGAASRCYQAGAKYGNPEFVQVHPTAIPGEDKCRLISESARGEPPDYVYRTIAARERQGEVAP